MMKNLIPIGLSILLAVGVGRAEETRYAGKPLAFWLEQLKDGDPLVREEAILVLTDARAAARAAMPGLQALLKDRSRGVRLRAALALWRIEGQTKPAVAAMTEVLGDPSSTQRAELLSYLGEMGGAAAGSAAVVLPLLHEEDGIVRTQAMLAIRQFGTAALPAILAALSDAKPRVRRDAFQALGLLGPSAKDAVPKLTALLDDDDAEMRRQALFALGHIGEAARSATKAILKRTRDRDAGVRAASLTALQTIAADAKGARAAALHAFKDSDLLVRCRGVLLLRQVDPQHADVLPQTLDLLEQPVGRSELLLMLNQMGPSAGPAVPALAKLLDDADATTRRLATLTLGNIGPAARPAVPALLRQLRSTDVNVRQMVVNALRAIRADSERLVPAVLEAVKEDQTTRSMYLPLLADQGAKAAAAVPWLVEELHRPPSYLTMQLAETLHQIDPQSAHKEAVPVLRKLLKPAGPWRAQAARTLRQLKPDDDEALQTLIECVTNDLNLREQACHHLGTLGKSAQKAAPALRKALGDSTLSVRVAAAAALWKINGETEATVPVLLEALKPVPNNYWRPFAAIQLGEMGSAIPATALPALRKYQDDPHAAVRHGVRQAIQRIEESTKKTPSP
jgi:HEAT repeat protein